jgi:hypothetical protein
MTPTTKGKLVMAGRGVLAQAGKSMNKKRRRKGRSDKKIIKEKKNSLSDARNKTKQAVPRDRKLIIDYLECSWEGAAGRRRGRRDEGFENNKNVRGALIVIGRGRCFLCFAAKKKVVSGCGAGLPRWNTRELL